MQEFAAFLVPSLKLTNMFLDASLEFGNLGDGIWVF